jgi:hypothetical protein
MNTTNSRNAQSAVDPLHVSALSILKNNGQISQKDFVNTGRITTIKDFLIKSGNPSDNLRHDCLDIMMYIKGFYIQMLADGAYYFEADGSSFYSKDLKLAESILWEYFASKKINTK